MAEACDAIVVGSGPNGLAAAIALARAGRSVRVLEAAGEIGGGTRTAELTLPGFRHDVCSAIHPLDDGTAVALHRSVAETAAGLGSDAAACRSLMAPLVRDWDALVCDLLGPLRRPRHPVAAARFARHGLRSANALAGARFAGPRARALLAGNAAHSMLPLERAATASYALVLETLGHGLGWPMAIGGSQAIAGALAGAVPWTAAECRRAGTVHLGGPFEEIARAEAEVGHGGHPERPYVLVAQQSLADATRAPDGAHTLWAYCHVPNGSAVDMRPAIERQIERFAPGFRDLVLGCSAMTCADMEAHDANYAGGDINGGAGDLRQIWARPVARRVPYATPDPRLFICSASTPPGGGVHGMCGRHAAAAALRGVLA